MQHSLAALLGTVLRTMRRYGMVSSGDRILVAVSGGADSVGLLAVLEQVHRRLGAELVAAHVHHGLRGEEADADEACAAQAASKLGIPFVRAALGDELRRGGNIEARARRLRYRALHRLADQNGCQKIATGHTRDDQAETFLLRLIRGSGARGLSAILPTRPDGVVRPLLECGRRDVEKIVRSQGLEYRTDASNIDPRYLRTHVRHRVLPLLSELNPSIVQSLARAAERQRTQSEIVGSWVSTALASVLLEGAVSIAALRRLPAGWAAHVIRAWLERAHPRVRALASVHVESVLELAFSSRASGRLSLPGGLRVRRRGDVLLLGEPVSSPLVSRSLRPGEELHLPGGWRLSAVLGDRESIHAALPTDLWSAVCASQDGHVTLTVRAAGKGERVRPLGMRGRKKLTDLFIDRKVPSEERASYPVVDHAGSIVWVPGVVRAEALRVEADTRRVLRLRAERNPSSA